MQKGKGKAMAVTACTQFVFLPRLHQPPPNFDARSLHCHLVWRPPGSIHDVKGVSAAVIRCIRLDLGTRDRQATLLQDTRHCCKAAKPVNAVDVHLEAFGEATLDGGLKHALELGSTHSVKHA